MTDMSMLAKSCPVARRCPGMTRTLELLLAGFGAAVCVGIAAAVWHSQARSHESLWPLPAVVLLELGTFGLVALAAVVSDTEDGLPAWGLLTWAIVGGLLAVMILGAWSIGPLVLPAVAALCSAALLANFRRGRRVTAGLALTLTIAVVNGVLLLTIILLAR